MSRWNDEPGKYISRERLFKKLEEMYEGIGGFLTDHSEVLSAKLRVVEDVMRLVLDAPSEPSAIELEAWQHSDSRIRVPIFRPIVEDSFDLDYPPRFSDTFELLPLRVRVGLLGKAATGKLFVAKGALLALEPVIAEAATQFMRDLARYGFENFVDNEEGSKDAGVDAKQEGPQEV